ncbi:hypothetical protein [Massilia sp. BJB1822]|uniref:hypothetical protein n=1 Tax=Massilia sp. BJB1822 TaxID=2744470 RepID=UPI0015940995|nr:hypothetical protein [Massilia sp. BJB1822]NVD98142.1 hypothetical protein [Massilia sp. BJB1822]
MKLPRLLLLATASLLYGSASASPETEFWKWFQKNEAELFDFERNQEKMFDRLETEMQKVDSSLTFEFGPKQGSQREFVISADGIRSAFPSVEKLHATAPPLKKWKFIKFRQRREPLDIDFHGISVKAKAVAVSLERDGAKVGLTVLIPGYTKEKHESFAGIAFLFLDQALGEFDVETRVGFIEVAAPSKKYAQVQSLQSLPATFDGFFKR